MLRHCGFTVIENLPDIRADLSGGWWHPSSGMVHIFTHHPTRHVFHYSRLFLQILLPFFHKSKEKKQKQLSLSQQKQESYYQIMCSWLYGSYLVRSRQVFSFTFKYMFFYSFIHKLFWTVQSNCRYLSSSSA